MPFPSSLPSVYAAYDLSDWSTLFTDSGKTTNVTAVGDAVYVAADVSGNGRDQIQATAANRPIVAGAPLSLGSELVTNGAFAADSAWTKGAGWTISGGAALGTTTTADLEQAVSLTAGKFYVLTFNYTRSGGTLRYGFKGGTGAMHNMRVVGDNTAPILLYARSGNNKLVFDGNASYTGTIDNVSLKEVTAWEAPYGLYFDGISCLMAESGTHTLTMPSYQAFALRIWTSAGTGGFFSACESITRVSSVRINPGLSAPALLQFAINENGSVVVNRSTSATLNDDTSYVVDAYASTTAADVWASNGATSSGSSTWSGAVPITAAKLGFRNFNLSATPDPAILYGGVYSQADPSTYRADVRTWLAEISSPVTLATFDGAAIEASSGAATATGGALGELVGQAIEVSPGSLSVEIGVIAEFAGAAIKATPGTATATGAALATFSGAAIHASPGVAAATGAAFAEVSGAGVTVSAGAATLSVPPLPTPPRIPLPVVVVEVDTADGLRYFSDGRYVDASAGIVADARLGASVSFERQFTTAYWSSGRSAASIGSIDLINTDGMITELLSAGLRDRTLRLLIGDDDIPVADLTIVAVAIIERIETAGETLVRLVTAQRGKKLGGQVLSAPYSSGDQEGRPPPRTYGECFSIPALPTDIANLRFSLHDTTGNTVINVRDRGVTLTPTTQWLAYNTSPSFGFRLLQATSGRITADARGRLVDIAYLQSQIQNVVRCLLDDAGWSDYSTSAIESLQTDLGSLCRLGAFVDGSQTYSQLLDDIADSIGGFWYIDRLGQFQIDRLRLPVETELEPVVLELTEIELASEVEVSFDAAPGLSNQVAGLRNWHVLSTDELAGSVRDITDGLAQTKDYRVRRAFTTHASYSSADGALGGSREVESAVGVRSDPTPGASGARRVRSDYGSPTLYVSAAGLAQEATRRGALWAEPHWWYRCSVEIKRTDAALLSPNQLVSLRVIDHATNTPVYGLDRKVLRVVSVRGDVGEGRVDLVLWGGAPFDPPPLELPGGKE